jgi:hypothetical protein
MLYVLFGINFGHYFHEQGGADYKAPHIALNLGATIILTACMASRALLMSQYSFSDSNGWGDAMPATMKDLDLAESVIKVSTR